ncbi:unnamed protein product [Symbiodinium microadriaticum]|nr:unnamed protein product [Symbiodinium microadriaticum]
MREAEDGEKDPKRRKLSPENGEKGDETKDEVLRLAKAKETAKTDEESKEAVVDTKQDAATEAKEETKEEAKEDLEKFTVPQLKDKLRAAGLMVSGNKADLIKRLQAAKEAEANKTSTEPPPEQEGEKKEEKPDAPTAEAGKEEEKKDEAQDMQVDQEGEKKEEKGEEAAAGEADKEGDKKEEAESKEKEAQEEEDNVDYLKELDEEIEQADNDVFEIEDVTDIGTGEPLFFNFGFEDWALLSLRFELHLLAHAFLHDCGDPERSGIYPDHLLFYYNRYYKKGLNPKNYGVEGVEVEAEAERRESQVFKNKKKDKEEGDEDKAIVAALDFPDRAHAWLGKVWEKELDENELRDSEVFSTLDAKKAAFLFSLLLPLLTALDMGNCAAKETVIAHNEVVLNIYDVNAGTLQTYDAEDVEKNGRVYHCIGNGFFHVGCQVGEGTEWAYAFCEQGSGIFKSSPKENPMKKRSRISVGISSFTSEEEIKSKIESLMGQYRGDQYDLLHRNCCNFAESLCRVLEIPEDESQNDVINLTGAAAAEVETEEGAGDYPAFISKALTSDTGGFDNATLEKVLNNSKSGFVGQKFRNAGCTGKPTTTADAQSILQQAGILNAAGMWCNK